MPEAATIEAPPSQAESTGGGIAEFTNQLAATVAKEMAEPAAVAPSPEVTATPEAKPEAKIEAAKEKAVEPETETKPSAAEKKMSEWTQKDFDEAMKKAPSKAWKVYEFHKKQTEAKIAELEKKASAINAKPVESPGDAKKLEALEKQIKDYNDQIAQRDKTIADLDYTKSEEFQRNYVSKYNRIQTAALEEFKRLTLTEGEIQRPATEADFKRLMKRDIGEQFELVKQWLGDTASAQRLLTNLNRMEEIHAEAADAREQARQNAEQSRTKAELQTKEETRLYETQLEVEHNDLVEKFPEIFGDTDNQEAQTAMEKGIDFAKHAIASRANMSPADRAAHDAVLAATHGAFLRMRVENKAQVEEIETLKKELAKFRKSDPGSAGAGGKAPPVANGDDDIGGIEQMSAMYKKQ